ncbi:MAG: ABC transporter ATP-binding protein, partial [Acetobacteraceae bacterium]|nr:ABC transporter ATP-binding protein [Acetobacteraceae bacterium]
LLRELRDRTGLAILFISHDLGTVARIADRVAVLRSGVLVESGRTADVLARPRHEYTRALLDATPDPSGPQHASPRSREAVLEVSGLVVTHGRKRLFGGRMPVRAVDDVSFTLHRGETLGLVGESGCGKSSLARALAGLGAATGAQVGGRIAWFGPRQLVFQHPDASLNPRRRVGELIGRPLARAGLSGAARAREVGRWLERVRLPAEYARRFPHSLSGGEKQRVAIARAFAARPAAVICDEITSSLDVSVQAQVLELLERLQRDEGTALLFISHDLNVVRRIAHRLAVMYLGRFVEVRPMASGRLDPPMHPYTEALMSASPVTTPGLAARRVRLAAALPGTVPSGCCFRTRCPRLLGPLCELAPPVRRPGPEAAIACHIPLEDLAEVPPIWSKVA